MSSTEYDAFIASAREAASLATFDIEQLPEDHISRQALHNLLTAVDSLISALDATQD